MRNLLSKAAKYRAEARRRKLWQRVVSLLVCVVVFVTTYAQILPAIALEADLFEPDGHVHTDECYKIVKTEEKTELDCPLELHTHTAACYDADGALTCGHADFVVHTHDSNCYDENGKLVCTLPEIEEHTHTALCYPVRVDGPADGTDSTGVAHVHTDECYTETPGALLCGEEETDGHTHTEDCYASAEKELTCGFEENESEEKSEGTEETPDPFDGEDKDPQPICGQEEIELHTHTAACFGAGGAVVCGQLEVLEHQHTEGCFRVVQEASEEKVLDCAYTGSADKADEERPADSSTGKDEEKPADSGATGVEDGGKEDGTTAPSDPDDELILIPATLAERVLAAAESYIGYKEDAEDCDIDADGETRGLTQFGLHYGMPYEKWDAMFVAYCLEEAGVEELPSAADCLFDIDVWASMLDGAGYCQTAELYTPAPGDVAFFDLDGDGTLDHVAFVEKVTDTRLFVIAGDSNDCVRRASYARADESVVGYGVLPRDEDELQDSPADEPDEGTTDDGLTGGPSEDETEDDPAASDPMDGPQDDGDNKTDEEDKKDEDADQDSTQEVAPGLAGRVLAAAQAEFGYTSAPDGTTLYRTFYDDPTAPLDVLFVAYCLDQAGIEGVPSAQDSGFDSEQWRAALAEAGMFRAAGAEEAAPAPGEVLFLDKDGDGAADFVAIVEKVAGGKVHVLEMAEAPAVAVAALALDTDEENGGETTASAAASCVRRVAYSLTDTQVLGYTALASLEDEDTALTEEEQAQVDEVIALIDALPTQKEIEEKLTAFEDAGDEDGYDAYLAEVIAQVKEAHEAYEALSEAQKLKVTNAVRLMALEPLWSAQTLEIKEKLTDDSAYVSGIAVTKIDDGTGPFDDNDNVGNDSSAKNKIVRTFDTVTYEFEVTMASYNTSNTYSEARVKLEFVLPLTADQATFDQGAMAWMDQTTGYAPALTTEKRTINGVETQCQVLTCYMHLLPSEGHSSVVPGTFGENVTINVKSMKNGDQFAPIFSAAMEYGTWEGDCTEHNQAEKATVTADEITVSAAPKYNIRIGGSASYKTTFDFSTGNETAKAYDAGYFTENSQVTGRVIKYGIVVQLYNDNASKGLKGIELPDGNNITFDVEVSSQFTINMPNTGSNYTQGSKVDTTSEYTPLLWSCDGNIGTSAGQINSDGRVLYDSHGCAQAWAPYASGGGANACYNSGTWTATQNGSTIHVTVSGYRIDVDQMPTTNGDTTTGNTGAYGVDLGIGCFSAGELWLVQPYNKIGTTSNNQGPNFDVVTEYGQGKFDTNVQVVNMKATTISGSKFEDPEGTSNAQTKINDDAYSLGVELTLPGGLQNRVAYANPTNYNFGVGVNDYRNGLDFATPGTEIRLLGGFSYNHRNEEENTLYWGTNLTKFYGSAIELTNTKPNQIYTGGAQPKEWMVYYVTKPDGTDWEDDNELLNTYEDSLVFYKSPSEIPSGHLCVGLLFCFKEDTFSMSIGEPYFFIQQPAKVRDNMGLSGKSYMLASTSRVWTKAMFEQKDMTLDSIPDWTNPNTKLSNFPAGYYKSANIEGSTWYVKTDYSKVAETGAVTDHNSDWRHWGDTLLVIGYKTGITKNLVQKGDENTDKNTYNLDAEQRVVDFKLQPRTYYDQGSGNHSLTTTVTIVDTLPKYLTYRPGSAYFGGTYTQTSVNGGTQGTITEGKLQEPTVTNNPDGTQTLTWVITNVTVGEDMPAIYYSADIGDRNNPNEDVPTGTTNLVNQVRISATHDIRQPSLANGNYAEAGIAVTRGSASSFGKYSKQKLVEPDGRIDYVIYYDNNAVSEAKQPVLVDAMPVNEKLGSNFSGTWEITSFKISLKGESVESLLDLDAQLTYTTNEKYAGKDLKYLQDNNGTAAAGDWTTVNISADGTVIVLKDTTPVMWVLNCNHLPGNSELRVEYTIQLIPEDGKTLENIKYVNQFSTSTTTTTTETPAVRRTLEGLTWMDNNADGIQNEKTDRRISGVKVELLKLKENGDSTKESDYESYCYPGTTTPIVIETGKQISVRASKVDAATDYELGRYKFTDLPAGTFAVRFEDGSTQINGLIASPSNRGTDDTQDSDGIATYAADSSSLKQTVILGIEMPKAEDMSVTLYESKYHDSGFYEKGHELPMTGGPGATPYTIGGLVAAIGAGLLLLYKDKRRRKKESASS